MFSEHWFMKYISCRYLSYIHLGSSVCHPVCRPVVCHIPVIVAERWAILYVLVIKLTKETRRRVWRWRDYRWRDRKETDRRGRVWIYFSLLKPNLRNMYVYSATCSCSIELNKQWYALADFSPNFWRVFLCRYIFFQFSRACGIPQVIFVFHKC